MKLHESIRIASEEITGCLTAAGFLNGDLMDDDEIGENPSPEFWETKAPQRAASVAKDFIVYRLQSLEPVGHGDDLRDHHAVAYVDLWTFSSFSSTEVETSMKALEKAFDKKGWGFELGSTYYDSSSKRHQISIRVTKTIKEA